MFVPTELTSKYTAINFPVAKANYLTYWKPGLS